MRAESLPEGYARALETGLWPSLVVLPPAERAATRLPIQSAAIQAETIAAVTRTA